MSTVSPLLSGIFKDATAYTYYASSGFLQMGLATSGMTVQYSGYSRIKQTYTCLLAHSHKYPEIRWSSYRHFTTRAISNGSFRSSCSWTHKHTTMRTDSQTRCTELKRQGLGNPLSARQDPDLDLVRWLCHYVDCLALSKSSVPKLKSA